MAGLQLRPTPGTISYPRLSPLSISSPGVLSFHRTPTLSPSAFMTGKTVNRAGRAAALREIMRRWRGKASAAAPDVPPGHVAVVVGSGRRRFVVRATQLNRPAIQSLLREAEEEYGFLPHDGPISIPCDEAAFLEALRSTTRAGSPESARLRKYNPDFRPGKATAGQPLLLGFS